MSTTSERNARAAKRYRVRKELADAALFNGIQPVELAYFGVRPDGTHVAIGYDKQIIPLVVRVEDAVKTVEQATAEPVAQAGKKLYVPKGVSQADWDKLLGVMATMTRAAVIADFEKRSKADGPNADTYRKLRALVAATPDVPEWIESLPTQAS